MNLARYMQLVDRNGVVSYKGHNFTASPYGLINANKAFKFVPSENR